MNLIEFTHVGNGEVSAMPSDAALLSMLPFGLARREALAQFFSCERNGNRSVKKLNESGMIDAHTIEIESKRENYKLTYYTLTYKGLSYIADKYQCLYPWLIDAVDELTGNRVNFLRGLSPGTVRALLIAQTCNVYFNVVGSETLYDRLIFEPTLALTVMQTHANTTQAARTSFNAILLAYRRWVDGLETGTSEPVSVDRQDECHSRFYDSVELKIPDQSPYRSADAPVPDDGPTIPERRERMPGHVGLLRTGQRCYVVYMSNRDGCSWNSSIIKKSWQYYTAEAIRLGLFSNFTEAPSVYPSILLVDGVGEKVSAFRRVVRDPCHLRGSRDRIIGRGTSALHAFPITRDARMIAFILLREEYMTANWVAEICMLCAREFSIAPLGSAYPLIYKGMPCYLAAEMDLLQINLAVRSEEPCAVYCLDWQIPYLAALSSDLTIFAYHIDSNTFREHRPKKQKE